MIVKGVALNLFALFFFNLFCTFVSWNLFAIAKRYLKKENKEKKQRTETRLKKRSFTALKEAMEKSEQLDSNIFFVFWWHQYHFLRHSLQT